MLSGEGGGEVNEVKSWMKRGAADQGNRKGGRGGGRERWRAVWKCEV